MRTFLWIALFPQLRGHLEQRGREFLRFCCGKIDGVTIGAIKRSHSDRLLLDPDADIAAMQVKNRSVENFDKGHLIHADAIAFGTGVSG